MIPLECEAINKTTISTDLAAKQAEGKEAKSWSELVPPCYDPGSSLRKRNDVQGRMARLQFSRPHQWLGAGGLGGQRKQDENGWP